MLFQVCFSVHANIEGVPDLPAAERSRLLEAHLDDVMAELLNLAEAGSVIDPDLSVTFSTGEVEFTMIVKAKSLREAEECADSIARAAVHAAGGFTADWWSLDWGKAKARKAPKLADA